MENNYYYNNSNRSRSSAYRSSGGNKRRRRRKRFNPLPLILVIILTGAIVAVVVMLIMQKGETSTAKATKAVESSIEETTAPPETTLPPADKLIEKAEALAVQYDYDGALEVLSSEPALASNSEVLTVRHDIEAKKASCVLQDPQKITHIFFHSLIVDTSLAFDGDSKQDGYNQVMTTVDEFNKILQQMYERGYVLVSLHDIAGEVEDKENGGVKMEYNDIYLPEGKKAFVMSQDDLCYYEYQKGDGLATRMIVGEDGRPVCEYTEKDGSIKVGSYDLVPLLDDFLDKHPDFSYKGAKAALAFTGYNGILGYRTDESYSPESPYYDAKMADAPNDHIEDDRKEAVKVLKALVADGFELASHSWGHLDMGKISYDRFEKDCDRWERNVNSLIKEATGAPCDIIIYPKGADIGSWRGYESNAINSDGGYPDGYQRFCLLHDLGFRYYCNVDSSQYFVQKGTNYLRMGRRNVDGDRMWRDIANPEKAKLSDLIDVKSVFDPARPTPVPGY